MPNPKPEKLPRKLLPIIYVLDTSSSMEGQPIAAVNSAMNETMEVLKDIAKTNPTAELKIGVLQFASGASWITDQGFVYMEDFYWNDLKAGGLTDYGDALKALNEKLSRKQFLESPIGFKAPVIIFMSDGEPTDNYDDALNTISGNQWFQAASKIAIAVGDYADIKVLEKIVGNREAVIQVDDLEALKKLIRVVSVAASKFGSQSRTNNNITNDIINDVHMDDTDNDQKVVTIDPPTTPPGIDTGTDWTDSEKWN